jgi:ribosomal protein L32
VGGRLGDEPAYDSDATLPIEGDYAYATEAERATRHHMLRVPVLAPAAPAVAAAPAAVMSVRVCLEWKPKMPKTWAGAVPSARKTNQKNAHKKARVPKKLRVALPVGVLDNDEEATLAHGVLVKGMAGGKREERLALL